MEPSTIETLKQDWTRRRVVVTGASPTLRRFDGRTGTVMTVNMSGRALVQFDGGGDVAWYDLEIADLECVAEKRRGEPVVPHPQPVSPVAEKRTTADDAAEPQTSPPRTDRPSTREILELARRQGAAKQS
jgi:hypothetical protein